MGLHAAPGHFTDPFAVQLHTEHHRTPPNTPVAHTLLAASVAVVIVDHLAFDGGDADEDES